MQTLLELSSVYRFDVFIFITVPTLCSATHM